jgi:hypothetical protein
MKNTLPLLIILLFTISCHQKRNSDETITKNKTVITSFEIENEIKDSIECELSEIADNLQLIRLETSDSVLMGGIYSMVLWGNYVIIGTERDYYLFNKKGKFIRRLLNIGRGPDEFIFPTFSKVIRNGILYFSDSQKSRNYIYSIDLETGKLDRIPRPNSGYIQRFFPDTDTTFIVLSEDITRDNNTPLTASRNYSIIRQDFKGLLLNKIIIGTEKEISLFEPSIYSMFINNGEILISKPRFDTLFRINDFKIQPIWQNIFKTDYDQNLSNQKVQNARLVNYSDSSIIMVKYMTEITITINERRAMNRDAQLLFLDRRNNKVQIIRNFYFKDKNMQIGFSPDIQLINGLFCIVLKAKDVAMLLNNQLINKSISDMIIMDAPRTNKPITEFDNPFLLIGQFK